MSLPVIIHLLAKRKSKLIDFPSLKFLKLLEQDALKKFNVKQLILLIIRTLMILLIILAFARPNLNLRSGFSINTQSVDLLVFALDNSASSRANYEALTGSWLQKFSSELKEKGFKLVFMGITDLELKDSHQEITPAYSGVYAGDLEARLSQQIDLEPFRWKSIVWLGDGQDVENKLENLTEWNKYLLWKPIQNDMGISSVDLPERGLRQAVEYKLQVGIEHANADLETASLELLINESRQNQVVIEPGANFVELSARVLESGFQEGRLELSRDVHNFNDVRHFILPAGGNIPVQILRSSKSPDFWRIIETAVEEMNLNLEIHLTDYSEIDNLNLSQGGTVIVEDASRLVEYNWNRLKAFNAAGGQLILFGDGGPHMLELLGFNAPLTKTQNRSPLGLYLTQTAGNDLKQEPLKAAIAQDRLKIYSRYSSSGNELEKTWIRYLDDQPFLGMAKWGDGRTIWFNTDFGIEANNLPLLGMFPALMLQLCQSQELKDQTTLFNVEIGDTLHFNPNAQEGTNTPYSIQRPDGTVDFLSPDPNYIIHYPHTNIPGVYRLTRGRQVLQPMAVNITTHEAQAHSRSYGLDNSEMYVSEQHEDLVTEILDHRSGTALWPFLLSILLVLWVIETYLSRIKSTWRQHV